MTSYICRGVLLFALARPSHAADVHSAPDAYFYHNGTAKPIVTCPDETWAYVAVTNKCYKVLPYGSAEPILVEERYIKLYRKPRKKTA